MSRLIELMISRFQSPDWWVDYIFAGLVVSAIGAILFWLSIRTLAFFSPVASNWVRRKAEAREREIEIMSRRNWLGVGALIVALSWEILGFFLVTTSLVVLPHLKNTGASTVVLLLNYFGLITLVHGAYGFHNARVALIKLRNREIDAIAMEIETDLKKSREYSVVEDS